MCDSCALVPTNCKSYLSSFGIDFNHFFIVDFFNISQHSGVLPLLPLVWSLLLFLVDLKLGKWPTFLAIDHTVNILPRSSTGGLNSFTLSAIPHSLIMSAQYCFSSLNVFNVSLRNISGYSTPTFFAALITRCIKTMLSEPNDVAMYGFLYIFRWFSISSNESCSFSSNGLSWL